LPQTLVHLIASDNHNVTRDIKYIHDCKKTIYDVFVRPGTLARNLKSRFPVIASLKNRGNMFFKFGSSFVIVACILLHPFRIWLPYDIVRITCLQPSAILSLQLYRLLTHAFIHLNFYHIFFNLISFAPLALALEKQIGSLQFLHLMSLFAHLTGLITLFASILLSFVYPGFYNGCTVGISGIVFVLLTKECLDRKSSSMYVLF
jgi:membrane associated rhomboid family serine protease